MFRKFLAAVVLSAMSFATFVQAGVTLVDINANPATWNGLTSGLVLFDSADLGTLPDFGGTGINGPLTSAGSGVIPAGFLSGNITITTDLVAGQPDFFGLGPSLGAGNSVNALVTNDSADAMVIDFSEGVQAFEFTYVSWLGGGPVTMEVTRDSGFTTFYTGLVAPIGGGNRYGVLGTSGEKITSIRLLDLGAGFEGVTGSFSSFRAIPEPGSLLLVAVGLACCGMRRRSHSI